MVAWLRQLAAHAHDRCGGPGVGAVGMCFTGNFALPMVLEPSVLAPVMSQPSLPLDDSPDTFVPEAEITAAKRRLDAEDLTVLAYRFASPGGRLGVPHSIVTTSLLDEVGQPTAAARDGILRFLAERLHAGRPVPEGGR